MGKEGKPREFKARMIDSNESFVAPGGIMLLYG